MLVENIMSDGIISVNVNENIVDIAKLMLQENIGIVGVISDDKFIGVMTDRDIVTKVLPNKSLSIKDYVSRELVTIEKDASIDEALEKMGKTRVKRLVVTESGNPVGILSISDILRSGFDPKMLKALCMIYDTKKGAVGKLSN